MRYLVSIIKKIFSVIFSVIYLIAVPAAIVYLVESVMNCFGATEKELGTLIMYVVLAQAICYGLIWFKFLTGLYYITRMPGAHITAGKIVLALIVAPFICAFDWVRMVVILIVRFFRGQFGKGNASAGTNAPASDGDDRSRGGDGALKRYIQNALPRSVPSWTFGYASLSYHTVEISSLSDTVIVGAVIKLSFKYGPEYIVEHKSEIQSSVQSLLQTYASQLCRAALGAFEDYRRKYAGYDGEWQFKPGEVRAEFEQ